MSTRPVIPGTIPADDVRPRLRFGLVTQRVADYAAISKARLSLLVLAAAATGFLLGSDGPIDWLRLTHMLIGTTLTAFGASALNQLLERDADARMIRTANRPLPAGRMSTDEALLFGAICSAGGTVYLLMTTHATAAAIAAATVLLYVFAYTPLKRITPASLFAGAIPGALPPLIGFAAAHGSITYAAWLPVLLIFFWQYPHFLAISWLYREDYARGGFAMLAVRDVEGIEVGRVAVGRSFAMVLASLLPVACGAAGLAYAVVALVSGAAFIFLAMRMSVRRDEASARRLFHASLIYLPVVMTMMVAGRVG